MTTVQEVFRVLEEKDLSPRYVGRARPDSQVSHISEIRAATAGDLTWVSQKVIAADASILQKCRATVVIAPESCDQEPTTQGQSIIACSEPKIAITHVIGQLFGELTNIEWPAPGTNVHPASAVSPSAILAPGVIVGSGVRIGESVEIGPNTVIANSAIASFVKIGANCSIGLPGFGYEKDRDGHWCRFPHIGTVKIGQGVEIGSNVCIDRGALGTTFIDSGCKIDNLVHIAHNVTVSPNTLLIAHAMIGGSVHIGENTWVAPCAAIKNQIQIGANAVIGLGAVVIRDVLSTETVVGNPARKLVKP